ncbi:MAG TPA: glycosyltransferase family 39 protein [Elusimicrobiota bacterium]|nr:glycosyltransferase family 39 protein [Elusimicrobiota bacterium]
MTEQRDEITIFEGILFVGFSGILAFLSTQYFYSPDFSFFAGQFEDAWTAAHWAEGLHQNRFSWKIWYWPIYPGVLSAHLMTPFFYLFENSWEIIRFWPMAGGLATALFGYMFMRKAFGVFEAIVYMGLSSLNFGYVLAVRAGHYHQSAVTVFVTITLWTLHRWWITRSPRWLTLAFLSMGMGFLTRAWFIWFLAGLFAGALFLLPILRGKSAWRMTQSDREIAVRFAVCFLPFVVVGLVSQFIDFRQNAAFVLRDSPGFFDIVGNFQSVLAGSFFGGVISSHGLDHVSHYFPYVALYGVMAGGIIALIRCTRNEENMIGAVWLVFAGMFCMAWWSPRIPTYHLFVFYPIIFILMSAVLGVFFRRVPSGYKRSLCGLAVCVFLVFLEKPAWKSYYETMGRDTRVISRYVSLIRGDDPTVPVLNFSRSNNMRFVCPNHRFLVIPEGMTFDEYLRGELHLGHMPVRFVLSGFRHEFPADMNGGDPLMVRGYREESRDDVTDDRGNVVFRHVRMSR